MPIVRKRISDKEKNIESYSITIDKDIVHALKLDHGDKFYWIIEEKRKGKRKLILQEI